jgi:monofunctional biosynthetic peptidoglycan transglycosylase
MRRIGRAILALLAAGFGCAAYIYLTLPDVRGLRTSNPETTAFIELRASEASARGEAPRRSQRWVSYSRISPNLTRAVLVTEDSKFWRHAGIDFDQLKESMETNFERMEFARGGSTITQQLAKNLYLSPSKNPIRKVRELLIARRLEAELSKQRILELYLNVIEWGDGIYGAEAAARTYFRKSATALTPDDAALLAAAISSPRVLDPGHPSARLRRRQQMVMGRLGLVTPPPAVATLPALEPPPVAPLDGPVAPLDDPVLPGPGVEGAPAVLPGQPLPPPKGPGGKPPAGAGWP